MTSKEKIREVLAVYHEYAEYYDEYDEWNKVDFNYDGETFRIFEEDVEKVKELIKDLEQKEKQDKILEIIFKKNVDIIHLDVSNTVEDYNHLENVGDDLTQEEFDLLKEKYKEVLNNDK